jgi:hypothetical protein
MNIFVLSKLAESILINFWAVLLLSVIFYFVFKAGVKNAIREVIKEEIVAALNDNKRNV